MSDAVETKHPAYRERVDEWSLMRDTAGGEKEVIGAGVAYLPQPSGFKAQADGGTALYDAYLEAGPVPGDRPADDPRHGWRHPQDRSTDRASRCDAAALGEGNEGWAPS